MLMMKFFSWIEGVFYQLIPNLSLSIEGNESLPQAGRKG